MSIDLAILAEDLQLLAWSLDRFARCDNDGDRRLCYGEATGLVDRLATIIDGAATDPAIGYAIRERLADIAHHVRQAKLELHKRPDAAIGSRPWQSGPLQIDPAIPKELQRLAELFAPVQQSEARPNRGGRPKLDKSELAELLREFEQGQFENRWKSQREFAEQKGEKPSTIGDHLRKAREIRETAGKPTEKPSDDWC